MKKKMKWKRSTFIWTILDVFPVIVVLFMRKKNEIYITLMNMLKMFNLNYLYFEMSMHIILNVFGYCNFEAWYAHWVLLWFTHIFTNEYRYYSNNKNELKMRNVNHRHNAPREIYLWHLIFKFWYFSGSFCILELVSQ